MSDTIYNNKRIAKNTLLLYIRMILVILIQLYTVPIILKTLGIEDYGIYNVVGGIVTIFSFIGGSLASGSQRFIAFEIGRKDNEQLKKVFDTTITTYIALTFILFLLLEIGGYLFLNYHMNIGDNRLNAANWVFQLSILSFSINLISIPYNATIIAHERMSFFAYISIVECTLKLLVAILLQFILFDHLITYAILICSISIIIRIIYQVYCHRNFSECRNYRLSWNIQQGKELLVYSGYNVIGSLATILKKQGINIIMNLFFGTILNAAHSIAIQINGVFEQFITNIYMASRPQITKLYASNQNSAMWKLSYLSNTIAFYLLMIVSIPCIVHIEFILSLWLGNTVPLYTSTIVKLIIISLLIESTVAQIIAVCQAYNKIKYIQIFSSSIVLLNVPLSYILLRIYPNITLLPYYIQLFCSILFIISILVTASKVTNMDLKYFIKNIFLRYIFTFSIVYLLITKISSLHHTSLIWVICIVLLTIVLSAIVIWILGLNKEDKIFILQSIKNKYHL